MTISFLKLCTRKLVTNFLTGQWSQKEYQNTNYIIATTESLFKAERKLFHECSYGRNFCM